MPIHRTNLAAGTPTRPAARARVPWRMTCWPPTPGRKLPYSKATSIRERQTTTAAKPESPPLSRIQVGEAARTITKPAYLIDGVLRPRARAKGFTGFCSPENDAAKPSGGGPGPPCFNRPGLARQKAAKELNVLYIAPEDPLGVEEHAATWCLKYQVQPEKWAVASRWRPSSARCSETGARGADELIEEIKRDCPFKPDFVINDTLSASIMAS